MAEIISALTASGHKSICVYDIRLNLLGRIESWVSLVWPERYNVYSDTQGAQLELHDTTALQALCRPDRQAPGKLRFLHPCLRVGPQ